MLSVLSVLSPVDKTFKDFKPFCINILWFFIVTCCGFKAEGVEGFICEMIMAEDLNCLALNPDYYRDREYATSNLRKLG